MIVDPSPNATNGAPRRPRIHHTSHSARMIIPAAVAWQPKSCQWPFGDLGDPGFRFCGAPVTLADGTPATDGRAYCPEHMVRAYETAEQKAERLREQRRRAAAAAGAAEPGDAA